MEAKHGVHEKLLPFLVPIEELVPLKDNPRHGNVDAIAASYEQFGQLRPLVTVLNDDGTQTVIAGNHQLEAARRLGWTHVAATPVDLSEKEAVAFALADNRTAELGDYDDSLLYERIVEVADDMPDLFDDLGWDDFERAVLETAIVEASRKIDDPHSGFTPPTLARLPGDDEAFMLSKSDEEAEGVVTRGATTVQQAGPKASVQYTIVFDDAEQQKHWYAFLRWLKERYSDEGETTAARIVRFIQEQI